MKQCEGTGPKFVKVGKIFYYREGDKWLRAGRISSTAQARKGVA